MRVLNKGQMDGLSCLNTSMDGWMDFCLYKWMDGWMDGCNECMTWFAHANMDGWLNDEYTHGFSQIRMDDSSDGLIYGHRNGRMKWFASAQTVARTDVWPRRSATRSQPQSRSLNEERLRRDPVTSPAPSEFPRNAQIPSSLFSSHINAITPAPNQLSAPVSDCCFAITHCQGRPRRYTSFATLIWIMYHSSVQGCGPRARVVSQFRTRGLAWKNANGHISAAVSWQRFILR